MIEASLAVISACLPTIRPVFRNMSPSSLIRSVHRNLSLSLLRSSGGKHDEFDNPHDGNRKDSSSSAVGLKDIYGTMGRSGLDNEVTHPSPIRDAISIPRDGMIVHKSFTMAEETV